MIPDSQYSKSQRSLTMPCMTTGIKLTGRHRRGAGERAEVRIRFSTNRIRAGQGSRATIIPGHPTPHPLLSSIPATWLPSDSLSALCPVQELTAASLSVSDVLVLASPFSRTLQTATTLAQTLGELSGGSVPKVEVRSRREEDS